MDGNEAVGSLASAAVLAFIAIERDAVLAYTDGDFGKLAERINAPQACWTVH